MVLRFDCILLIFCFIGAWLPKNTKSFVRQGMFKLHVEQEGKYQKFHVIAQYHVKSFVECGHSCLADNDCTIIQYSSVLCKPNCKLGMNTSTFGVNTQPQNTCDDSNTYELLDAESTSCSPDRCKNGGTCVVNSNIRDGFICDCILGYKGKFCQIKSDEIHKSCYEAYWRERLKQDGVYKVQANTTSGYVDTYCQMRSLPGCYGGGWTMVMKINGTKKTFGYHSPLWYNNDSYNEIGGITGFDDKETKLPTYWSTSFKQICLGMKVGNTTRFLTINHTAKSLNNSLADGVFRRVVVKWKNWRHLIVNSSIQTKCQREGFNVQASEYAKHYAKVRLGIIGNEMPNYRTPDSFLGIGSQFNYWSKVCGNAGNDLGVPPVCGNFNCKTNGSKDQIITAMGYILVR